MLAGLAGVLVAPLALGGLTLSLVLTVLRLPDSCQPPRVSLTTSSNRRGPQPSAVREAAWSRAKLLRAGLEAYLVLHLYLAAVMHAAPLASLITYLLTRSGTWGEGSLPFTEPLIAALAASCSVVGLVVGDVAMGARHLRSTLAALVAALQA
jgi:hypothetical protein